MAINPAGALNLAPRLTQGNCWVGPVVSHAQEMYWSFEELIFLVKLKSKGFPESNRRILMIKEFWRNLINCRLTSTKTLMWAQLSNVFRFNYCCWLGRNTKFIQYMSWRCTADSSIEPRSWVFGWHRVTVEFDPVVWPHTRAELVIRSRWSASSFVPACSFFLQPFRLF